MYCSGKRHFFQPFFAFLQLRGQIDRRQGVQTPDAPKKKSLD